MSPDDIRLRLEIISAMSGDFEMAHSAEDALWRETLEAIADGADEPNELARLALATSGFDFPRHCA
jgi:hypothetical protein